MVDARAGKTPPNSVRTSMGSRKLHPSWKNKSRRRQDVIWLLSGNSASPIFRALIWKLICGWQRQAWVGERILDVIRRLTPSSFVDWSLIGNESTTFPLWGRQGRWQLEHMDWKRVSVWCFCSTQTHKLHFKQSQTTRQKAVTFLYSLSFNKKKHHKQVLTRHQDFLYEKKNRRIVQGECRPRYWLVCTRFSSMDQSVWI